MEGSRGSLTSTLTNHSGRASGPSAEASRKESTAADSCRDCNDLLVQPLIDFSQHDLFYLTVQYVPLKGKPYLLYQKYLKVMKPEQPPAAAANPAAPTEPVPVASVPVNKLMARIDMKIYHSNSDQALGGLSRCIELPNAVPRLQLPGLVRSVESAGQCSVFSLANIMSERLAQEANVAGSGISGFHSIYFGLYRVEPGGKFVLTCRRIQPISNSEADDFVQLGLISADHKAEAWSEPNHLQLTFNAPPVSKRHEGLSSQGTAAQCQPMFNN